MVLLLMGYWTIPAALIPAAIILLLIKLLARMS
jgi:hypothetical protein